MTRSQRIQKLKDFLDEEEKKHCSNFSHSNYSNYVWEFDIETPTPTPTVSVCNCGDPMFLPHRSTCPVVCRT
jgi:hypothetical protein